MRSSQTPGPCRLYVGLALTLAASAHAQDAAPGASQTAVARDLFAQGVELSQAEDWEAAADRFERSLALRDSMVVAYNLGVALVRSGRVVLGREHLRRAARAEGTPPPVRAAARQLLEETAPLVGRLRVSLDGDPEDVVVEVAGRRLPAAAYDVPTPADAGLQTVVATLEGQVLDRQDVDVPAGGEASVVLDVSRPEPEVDLAAAVDDALVPAPEERGGNPWPWVAVGVGAVLVAGAVLVVVLATSGTQAPFEGDLQPGVIRVGD
jgi:hypothetical protein